MLLHLTGYVLTCAVSTGKTADSHSSEVMSVELNHWFLLSLDFTLLDLCSKEDRHELAF